MEPTSRRSFVKAIAASPLAGAAEAMGRERGEQGDGGAAPKADLVRFSGDGLALSPAEYVAVLQQIVETKGIEEDYYSRGGVVEELERRMAEELGKERAIYFPTGTLANHVAVRELARERRGTRVLVPNDSHLYNDSGDCAQQLSHLNLVPISSETATFTLDQVREVVERTGTGRVDTGVGALVIESPVRRRFGETFVYEELTRICSFAREEGIGTHLDGARLYMASGYTGISPREYASHFDTVYVSLWKYFNAGSGAILAGSKGTIDSLYHTRRMFGGGLPAAWPFAAVALHYLETFEKQFSRAIEIAGELFARLNEEPAFGVQAIPNGSNLFRLTVKGSEVEAFRKRLRSRGVVLSAPRGSSGEFLVAVNPTLTRRSPDTLLEQFRQSL